MLAASSADFETDRVLIESSLYLPCRSHLLVKNYHNSFLLSTPRQRMYHERVQVGAEDAAHEEVEQEVEAHREVNQVELLLSRIHGSELEVVHHRAEMVGID